jgi:hypothetical protein
MRKMEQKFNLIPVSLPSLCYYQKIVLTLFFISTKERASMTTIRHPGWIFRNTFLHWLQEKFIFVNKGEQKKLFFLLLFDARNLLFGIHAKYGSTRKVNYCYEKLIFSSCTKKTNIKVISTGVSSPNHRRPVVKKIFRALPHMMHQKAACEVAR